MIPIKCILHEISMGFAYTPGKMAKANPIKLIAL